MIFCVWGKIPPTLEQEETETEALKHTRTEKARRQENSGVLVKENLQVTLRKETNWKQ